MASTQNAHEVIIDEAKVKKAILLGLPITINTFTITPEIKVYMEEVISIFLKAAGQERLKNHVAYCVHELVANAKKANVKRVFFSDRKLDLFRSGDYEVGMKHFKEVTLNNIAYYLRLQKEKNLYVKLVLQIRENIIYVEVRNNSIATRAELIRINDRLARTRQYKTLDEALSQVFDDTEGAGLGLVILILMLKKIGLDEDCFDISVSDKETVARITIPLSQVHIENVSMLSMKIANSVSSLPQFPEHIVEVLKLLDDVDVEMGGIAKRLSTDPAFVAGLLKVVNSAHYMLGTRVNSILDAVNMVGRMGIRNLVYSYETQRILGSDTEEKKRLWEHSHKAAFYAYNLAKNFRFDQDVIDSVYVSGLLHDIGKIALSDIHPRLMKKIHDFCTSRDIPHSMFEDISSGMNHAEIGALIAEKWNFPEGLVMAIRYHHNPLLTPGSHLRLVQCIYLSNMLCEYELAAVALDQFEPEVLSAFGISSKMQLECLAEKMFDFFRSEAVINM